MLSSVIIPVYNRPVFVRRAMESVLAQTFGSVELLVVDDGSTDETPGVLAELQAAHPDRVRVFSQPNKGVSAARNLGIRQARGNLLALLDSDDHWLPQKLERQVDYLLANRYEVCQTDEIWMRRGKRVNPMNKHAKPAGAFFARALELCLVSPSCVLFTRRFVEKVGFFDESLPACEDYDLWLRALLHYDIGLLNEKLVVRNGGRPDQLSARFYGLDLYRIHALVKLLNNAALQPPNRELARNALAYKAQIYTQGCLKRGRLFEAQRVRELVRDALDAEPPTPGE